MNPVSLWNSFFDFFVAPWTENHFMVVALLASLILSLSMGPLGVFLSYKKMSLSGEALSHSLLPGAALGYLIAGMNPWSIGLGALLTGLLLAFLSAFLNQKKHKAMDSHLAGVYLISLSLGVVLVSIKGTQIDLMHFLFGNLLTIGEDFLPALILIVGLSLLAFIFLLKALTIQTVDPDWFEFKTRQNQKLDFIFLSLVMVNLVISFQVLGTLMSVGLMILPAITLRLWGLSLGKLIGLSGLVGTCGAALGLLISYHLNLPSGATIVLVLGIFYLVSSVWKNQKN